MVQKRVNPINAQHLQHLFLRVGFMLLERFSGVLGTRLGLNLGYQLTRLSTDLKDSPHASAPHYLSINLEQPRIINDASLLNPFGDGVAIIIQGAVGNNRSALKLIISRYLGLYPLAHIILSTWEGEDTDFLQTAEKLHLIKSIQPQNPGIANINLQLVSTRAGIEFAEKLGCQYVVKCRSDQMLLNSTFLLTLYDIANNTTLHSKNSRIAISSLNTFCFRTYSISDMFSFGEINEMKNLWFIPLDPRKLTDIFPPDLNDKNSWSKLRVAENYVSSLYLENKGVTLDFTYQQYYKALSEYFVVIDALELGQTWTKYTHFSPVYNLNNFPHARSEVTSTIWRSLPIFGAHLAQAADLFDDNIG